MTPTSSTAVEPGAASRTTSQKRKEVNAMLRKLREVLSGRNAGLNRHPQFNDRLLDKKREDVYILMHQQMSNLR